MDGKHRKQERPALSGLNRRGKKEKRRRKENAKNYHGRVGGGFDGPGISDGEHRAGRTETGKDLGPRRV